MRVPSDQQAMRHIAGRLAELVDVRKSEARVWMGRRASLGDGVVEAGRFTFVVEWKGIGEIGPVSAAIQALRRCAKGIRRSGIPLVAVPFMGDAGRELCAEAGVAWMDLSGNARITAPGLYILVEGKPNQYKPRGRPASVFAPKSSRITRWLLCHAGEPVTQRELAKATGIDEGYTSKVVGKLADDGLIVRQGGEGIEPRNPSLLLHAWREAYDFSKHRLLRGYVEAPHEGALLRRLADALERVSAKYAATGLAAAWLMDPSLGLGVTTLYLEQDPSPALLEGLSFRDDARSSNVWLAIPNDEGVFHCATTRDGIRCVHPVQAYLDLLVHPNRADDAAKRLRREHLSF